MEAAAEARDVGNIMAFVAPDFQDAYGRGIEDLTRTLHGYFIANQSLHLLTRINEINFPIPEEVRLQVTVATVGREADAAANWNLAADLHDFDVTMRKHDGEWKVVHAKRK